MIDIDAVGFDNYLHMMTINNSEIIVPYIPPKPPANTGNHSYLFLVSIQTEYLTDICVNHRENFKLDNFISENKLFSSKYFTFIVDSTV